ncbi:glycosyltransferase family 2 protein [uncultured Alistipes sp.]|nr:glycosyltransferase family 2 protein [uncultured Alistipes sp.]
MKNNLTLAICMYNAEKYIEETLQCIIGQTMQDFYLLIVNDCSTDESARLVENFFKKHPRQYELVNLPENGGLCAGRRYVEDHATTRYLLFVDADDCPYPTLVETLYHKITSDNDLMAVGCHLEYMDSNGQKMKGGIFLGETNKKRFYEKAANEKLIFMQPTAIYDREVALRVGGHNLVGFPDGKPRYQDLCEDLDLWTRMSDLYKEGKAIVVVPEILCRYRKHEQALSSNSLGMMLRMRHVKINLKRRRRNRPELTFIEFCEQLSAEERRKIERKAISADSLRAAYYNLRRGKLLSSVKELYRSVSNDPGYIMDKLKHNLLRIK